MKKLFKTSLITLAILGTTSIYAQTRSVESLVAPEVRTSKEKEVSAKEIAELKLQKKCFNNESAHKVLFNYGDAGNEIMTNRTIYLCNLGYNSVYDPETKTPIFATQNFYKENKVLSEFATFVRPNPNISLNIAQPTVDYGDEDFQPLSLASIEDMDYNGTGKEKGQAIEEALYFTNIVPVVPGFKDVWSNIEEKVREWSKDRELFVATGVLFDNLDQPALYGPSKVWIPTRLYKVIYEQKTGKSIAFVVPNVQIVTNRTVALKEGSPDYWQTQDKHAYRCKGECTIKSFVTSVSQVEKAANLKFFQNTAGVDFSKIAPKYWDLGK